MANNNVIELVFKLRDQVTTQLGALRTKLGGFASSASGAFGGITKSTTGLAAGLAGVAVAAAGITGVVSAMHKVIDASKEAEDVLKKFDNAFNNIGRSSRKTREDILKFADDASKTSIFDDEKILQAQTALLQFRSVSGKVFDRARQDAIDLASAMGTDLVSAAELVGRSIERPEVAIRRLRSVGVLFSASQEKMIKSLSETGQKAKAAEIILGELERRFKGAGDAAANTLSGALARLKTSYDNLFETDTGPLIDSLNSLTDVFNDPEFRKNLQSVAAAIVAATAATIKWAAAAVEAGKALLEASANFQSGFGGTDLSDSRLTAILALNKELEEQGKVIDGLKAKRRTYIQDTYYLRTTLDPLIEKEKAYAHTLLERIKLLENERSAVERVKAQRESFDKSADSVILDITAGGSGGADFEDQVSQLTEVVVKATKVAKDQISDFYDQLNDKTQTTVQKEVQSFNAFNAALDELFAHRKELIDKEYAYGLITWAQYNDDRLSLVKDFNARYKEQLDKELEEVKVTVKKEVVPAIKTPLDTLVEQFSSSLERMLNNGKFTWRELGQYFLREVTAGYIKKAIDALSSALKKAFSQTGSSSSSSGGFFSTLVSAIGSYYGGSASRAGGGRIPRAGAWVGDDTTGPELVDHGTVYSANRLRSVMGGNSVSIASPLYVTVQGNADEKALAGMKQYVDIQNDKTQKLILQMMGRQGLRRPS